MPYFFGPRIEDVSASGMTRRQAILQGLPFRREVLSFILRNYAEARPQLTAHSLFVDVIEEHERAEAGAETPPRLQEILDQSLAMFEERAAEVEEDLDYTVVPIKELASVQLVTALRARDHVQRSPGLTAR